MSAAPAERSGSATPPAASIVIPTRDRPEYLRVTLASIGPSALRAGAEIIVVDNGTDARTPELAVAHGARLVRPGRAGANAARNAGAQAAAGPLIVFVDDDVEAPEGWLRALLEGADAAPDHDVFGGPIRAWLEGGGPRGCGREAPITTLDLGDADGDAELVWSANMAIRATALQRIGPFDETIVGRGEEEDWQRRYRAARGRIRYLAGAGLVHRRLAADATLPRLAGSAYALGRSARRYDVRKGSPPATASELRVLAGCLWHVLRRRCLVGLVLAAHSAGRLRERIAPGGPVHVAQRVAAADESASVPRPDDFLSGTHGLIVGLRATGRAIVADAVADAALAAGRVRPRLARVTRGAPRRRVLVLAVEREDVANVLDRAATELRRSHHDVELVVTGTGGRGKFENLNAMLATHPAVGHDWLIVLDDDVLLPPGFLDAFVYLAERFGLRLAQPAHRRRSHASFEITRRRAASVARETAFVEIGPVTAFHASTFATLLPFPELRSGWGLDAHWSAVAAAQGWPIGIIDATPIRHDLRQIAASYDPSDAIREARAFLADRPYTPAAQAQRTLRTHRGWR